MTTRKSGETSITTRGEPATPRPNHPNRPARSAKIDQAQQCSLDDPHAYVVQNGEYTHVLVPIDEYERLMDTMMIQSAIRKLKDPDTQWIDADQMAIEIAGERIVKARKAAGLTQKQLGEKLGVPQSQISRIERNPDHTTVRTMKKIAKALGVDVGSFLR
jgi:HTH-type transcriptional regulator / antitoxin HipB